MNKKRWIILGVIFLIILLGVFFFIRKNKKRFDFEPIKRGPIVESVYGIGILSAEKSFSVKTRVTATILKIYQQEGTQVAKNAPLIKLDGIGTFYAPFAGTITASKFKEGETIFPQAIVMSLVDLKDTYLSVSLEQQGALSIKEGLDVKISFDGMREQAFTGKVQSIYSSGDDFLARISVENLPTNILPGMTADVAIIIKTKPDVILIPVAAMEGDNVSIRRMGKEIKVPVKLGLSDGEYAEVIEGNILVGDDAIIPKKEKP